jgi:hypothetical protein
MPVCRQERWFYGGEGYVGSDTSETRREIFIIWSGDFQPSAAFSLEVRFAYQPQRGKELNQHSYVYFRAESLCTEPEVRVRFQPREHN